MFNVLVDPGHGGSNKGTSSPDGALVEKDLVLEIGKKLATALYKLDWDVIAAPTRYADRDLILSFRGRFGNDLGSHFVYTIHANNLPDVAADGVRCFYWPGNMIGKAISQAVADAFPSPLRQKTSAVQEAARGPQRNVLRYHRSTAVLVEVGFLDDPGDVEALSDPMIIDGIVAALLVGVAEARRLIPTK